METGQHASITPSGQHASITPPEEHHAPLSPSSASAWVKCHGYVKMRREHGIDSDSFEAAEGSASHYVGAELIKSKIRNETLDPRSFLLKEYQGVTIDQDMIDGAVLYANHVLEVADDYLGYLQIEKYIELPGVHSDCGGTPDANFFNADTGDLHIFDYKYGFRLVEAVENWQCLCYAAGAFGFMDKVEAIHIHVIQPRASHKLGPIRTWSLSHGMYYGYLKILQEAANAAMSEDLICTTGKHCRDCKARHACTALNEAGHYALDVFHSTDTENLNPIQLGKNLKVLKEAADTIKYLMTGLEAQAEHVIKGGTRVPGFTLELSRGSVVWNKGYKEVVALGSLYGVNVKKDSQLITPLQSIKAGLNEDIVKQYSKTQNQRLKLTETNLTYIQELLKN